jgi:hypothetical protein
VGGEIWVDDECDKDIDSFLEWNKTNIELLAELTEANDKVFEILEKIKQHNDLL